MIRAHPGFAYDGCSEKGHIDLLHKLIAYYHGVPAETARFTRDVEFLRQVAQQTAEREVLLQVIIADLSAYFHPA